MMHLDIISLALGNRYLEEGQVDLQRSDLEDTFRPYEPSLGRILMGIAAAYLSALLVTMILLWRDRARSSADLDIRQISPTRIVSAGATQQCGKLMRRRQLPD
jgi:hypothetical protein